MFEVCLPVSTFYFFAILDIKISHHKYVDLWCESEFLKKNNP